VNVGVIDADERLLTLGADIYQRTREGAKPLMQASQLGQHEMEGWLLEHRGNANAVDIREFTTLHRATEQGQRGMVEALLDAGAEPNPEASGHTPRSLATAHDHPEIVARLDRPIG